MALDMLMYASCVFTIAFVVNFATNADTFLERLIDSLGDSAKIILIAFAVLILIDSLGG